MGKFLFLFSFLLSLIACNVQERELDGAYEIVSQHTDWPNLNKDDFRTVALLKNGYWISTSFTQKSIIKCCGGTYEIKNGDCIQKYKFNSIDTSVIGKEYNFKYHSNDKYWIASFAGIDINKKSNSEDVYKKTSDTAALKNIYLDGVWLMKPGQAGYTNNNEIIRIFAYPYFVRTIYSSKEKRLENTYGGTYKFDGKELIEKIEYSNYQIPPGSTIEWSVKKINDNEIQLFDIDSFNDEEIFDQINNR